MAIYVFSMQAEQYAFILVTAANDVKMTSLTKVNVSRKRELRVKLKKKKNRKLKLKT